MNDQRIQNAYAAARERYAELGVDTEAAMARADATPVSMQCWQGDDVIGFDGAGCLSGGLATTGNYPGRAHTPEELRADIEAARGLIPGAVKINLHASYAERTAGHIDRDAYTIADFAAWADWAVEKGFGLDFNPTFFSHPMMEGDFSLSSMDEGKRRFWIEHGKRCREIGLAFAQRTGKPCVVNFWMPDGYKDVCADSLARRERMTASL
ncbi:MAG: L-rhamnose isomerase, partial [Clostridia bacterium]|nr:L-rhamnose isomerase [Clostridia bacterium]